MCTKPRDDWHQATQRRGRKASTTQSNPRHRRATSVSRFRTQHAANPLFTTTCGRVGSANLQTTDERENEAAATTSPTQHRNSSKHPSLCRSGKPLCVLCVRGGGEEDICKFCGKRQRSRHGRKPSRHGAAYRKSAREHSAGTSRDEERHANSSIGLGETDNPCSAIRPGDSEWVENGSTEREAIVCHTLGESLNPPMLASRISKVFVGDWQCPNWVMRSHVMRARARVPAKAAATLRLAPIKSRVRLSRSWPLVHTNLRVEMPALVMRSPPCSHFVQAQKTSCKSERHPAPRDRRCTPVKEAHVWSKTCQYKRRRRCAACSS